MALKTFPRVAIASPADFRVGDKCRFGCSVSVTNYVTFYATIRRIDGDKIVLTQPDRIANAPFPPFNGHKVFSVDAAKLAELVARNTFRPE